jgi:hypothetical protein
MYPSTYSMPSWTHTLLDTVAPEGLGRYYKDQSNNVFRIYGSVVGQTANTIFRSDPGTSVRPEQPFDNDGCSPSCGNSGGNAFFQNIMSKVDAVVNLANLTRGGMCGTCPARGDRRPSDIDTANVSG